MRFLMKEKTDRRFCCGGGELSGMGDDGGLDRSASSDQTADKCFGLDLGGSEDMARATGGSSKDSTFGRDASSLSVLSSTRSTRLRLVGGSSS